MKHSDYWRGRFEQLNEALLWQGVNYYDELECLYRHTAKNIEKDIVLWYQKLAANNGISYSEAKRLLNANELKEFHWTVEEYIKCGKENGIDQRWAKQLENASAKVHISRLEALKLQTQQHLEIFYGNHLDGTDKVMRNIYETGYYQTAFEVQRGLNVGYSFQQLDDEKLQKIISNPWAADGKNFSDRIWQDKMKMLHTLHTELTQATIRGDPPLKVTQTMAEKLRVSGGNAGRLVMTESAFFASASQRDCFMALEVEEYEIIATLDSHTSSICRDMDGQIFKQSDYKPGITAPPFHCWCRSCTAPHFADDIESERAARGEDGKTYYVPSDMKYEDWKKVYVDKKLTPKEWQKSRENGTIKKKGWQGVDYSPTYNGDKKAAIKRLSDTHGIVFSDSKKYPMDADLLDDCVSWLDAFVGEYNTFIEKNPCKIPVIKCQAPTKMNKSVGYYQYYINSPHVVELALNGKFHSSLKDFQVYVNQCIESKWYPANATAHKTFVHEFGHHIANSMRHVSGNKQWDNEFITNCIKDFNTRTGQAIEGYWQMGDHVSRYGETSVSELFAETFAEYFGGENPREFAMIFGEKLEKILRAVK